MKRALQILIDEHRHIERACRVLSMMAKKTEEEETFEQSDWRDIIDFIRGFADKCHHFKEEDKLFKLLVKRGLPIDGGPIGVMLSEHEVGRGFVKNMEKGIDNGNFKLLTENAYGYLQLLPEHIWKEDNILYQMAEQVLTDEDASELLKKYADDGMNEKFLRTLDRLSEKYGEGKVAEYGETTHACMACGL